MKSEREFLVAAIPVPTAATALPAQGIDYRMGVAGNFVISGATNQTVSWYGNLPPVATAWSIAADTNGAAITQAVTSGLINPIPTSLQGLGQIALIAGTAVTATVGIKS